MDKMTEAQIQAAQIASPAAAPAPPPLTDGQILQFVFDGRQRLTLAVVALRSLREWAETYDQRGADVVFGPTALEVANLNTDLQGAFNALKRAAFARLRTDI